ncbi:MAG: TatD family hydrolase [Flavobacteriales bacterium]
MHQKIDIHTHQNQAGFSIKQWASEADNSQPFSVAVHPWEAHLGFDEVLMTERAKHPNCVAIGETGLDKLKGDLEAQKKSFLWHIRLAKTLKKPLILHCVKAFEDCLACLAQEHFSGGVLFHGFSKHPELAKQLLRKGYFLSLGKGFLTKQTFDDLIIETELKHLFFETDNDTTYSLDDLYKKSAHLLPNKNIEELVYKNYQNWLNK